MLEGPSTTRPKEAYKEGMSNPASARRCAQALTREKRWRRPLLEMADHNFCDNKVALLHHPETLAQSAANLERCALVSPVLLTRVPMLKEPVMQRESRPSQEFGANTLWPHSLNQKIRSRGSTH